MKLKQTILAAGMLMAAAVPMQAQAATATATMNVNMVAVAPTGSVVINGPLDFGTVVTNGSTGSASTTLSVNVTNAVPYTIAMGRGLNWGAVSTAFREMSDPALTWVENIAYSLFTDAAHTIVWGEGTIPGRGGLIGNGFSGTGLGTADVLTVYGGTAAAIAAGTFSDTVTVTLTY